MRFAIWSYTVAVVITSTTVSLLGAVSEGIFFSQLGGSPLPALTSLLTSCHWGFLFIPAPFILAAIWLSRGENASADKASAFAGISTLAVVLLFAFTALALLMPFVTLMSPL